MPTTNIENKNYQFIQPWTGADRGSQKRIRVELTPKQFVAHLDIRGKNPFVRLINEIGRLIEPFFKKLGQFLKDWKKEEWRQGGRSLPKVEINVAGFKNPKMITRIEKIVLGLPQDQFNDKINQILFEKIAEINSPKRPSPLKPLTNREMTLLTPQVTNVKEPVTPAIVEIPSRAVQEEISIPVDKSEGLSALNLEGSEEAAASSDNTLLPAEMQPRVEKVQGQDASLVSRLTQNESSNGKILAPRDKSLSTTVSRRAKRKAGGGNLIKSALFIAAFIAGYFTTTRFGGGLLSVGEVREAEIGSSPFATIGQERSLFTEELFSRRENPSDVKFSQDSNNVCYPHEQLAEEFYARYSASIQHGYDWSEWSQMTFQIEKAKKLALTGSGSDDAPLLLSAHSWTPEYCYPNETAGQTDFEVAFSSAFVSQPDCSGVSWKGFTNLNEVSNETLDRSANNPFQTVASIQPSTTKVEKRSGDAINNPIQTEDPIELSSQGVQKTSKIAMLAGVGIFILGFAGVNLWYRKQKEIRREQEKNNPLTKKAEEGRKIHVGEERVNLRPDKSVDGSKTDVSMIKAIEGLKKQQYTLFLEFDQHERKNEARGQGTPKSCFNTWSARHSKLEKSLANMMRLTEK